MNEEASGRVASPPGSCRSGDAATASSSLRDGNPSRAAAWAVSDVVARLLAESYEAEQDDGEITLVYGSKPDAISVILDRRGPIFVLSPCRHDFPVLAVTWADILKALAAPKWQHISTVPEGVEVVVRGGRTVFGDAQRGSSITVVDDRDNLYRPDGTLRPSSPTMWHPAPEPPASGIEAPEGSEPKGLTEGKSPPLAEGDAHPHPDPFAGITTDPALLEALKRAAKREMTPAEHHAQRRSWIIGEMGIEHPELSREQLEALADRAVGPAPASEVKED